MIAVPIQNKKNATNHYELHGKICKQFLKNTKSSKSIKFILPWNCPYTDCVDDDDVGDNNLNGCYSHSYRMSVTVTVYVCVAC